MSGIFGHLNISDSDRVFASTAGQRQIFDAVNDFIARVNADLAAQAAAFIEEETEYFKERYYLPGGGHLQRRGSDGRYASVKATGSWDVSYPLEDFGAQQSENDVDRAYMTIAELDRHLRTMALQNANTLRFEILKALLNNTADTFVDPLHGSLTIQPLANGDTVVYPPVLGSETEATEDHYLESGYTAANISDTNNPYSTIRDELEHHFGVPSGGSNILCFINNAQRAKSEDLTDYDAVTDRFTRPGQDTDQLFGMPSVPGTVLGRVSGVWVVEWRWVPSGYIVGLHADAPKPLKKRADPADTGLGRGLQLVSEDEEFPFRGSFWRHRFGLGCGNRLNGVVMELGTGGTYSIPSGYS